jgi:F-box-like
LRPRNFSSLQAIAIRLAPCGIRIIIVKLFSRGATNRSAVNHPGMLSSPSSSSKGKGKQVQISLSINRTMSFDGASIPDDIWLTVFDLLGPAELGSLSRTCTKFHQLTQRPLLREITWSRANSAERNVADWGAGGSLAQFTGIPRKVNIRLNFKKVNQNGALVAVCLT